MVWRVPTETGAGQWVELVHPIDLPADRQVRSEVSLLFYILKVPAHDP